MRLASVGALALAALTATSARRSSQKVQAINFKRASTGLQDVVTWDEYSLKINGERVFIFSGEVHPYRMPVQSLHLDIFQKIKSLGFNAVSFYVFWGLHEPKRGHLDFTGFRDLQPFFDAAREAGIYLIARPGPYINAETTGGGFPGWGTYDRDLWRTENATYYDAWQGYMAEVGAQIAKNEITKGGPVILVQSENEYTGFQSPYKEDRVYEQQLLDALHKAGITVPITTNDASPGGHYTSVDIWGYDSYPNGFDCSHPYTWGSNSVPESFWASHMRYSPNVPNSIYEFQGGAFDGWGGSGYDTCGILTGPEFERVFYKNNFAQSTATLNLYMIYGGTNWAGTAHPGVYTSYDYGSAIAEDRTLREKYYELKLQANFLKQSPAYLTTRPQNPNAILGAYTGNSALKTSFIFDVVGKKTGFFIVRQSDANSAAAQTYKLTVPTTVGNLTLPTLGGSLTLTGKDSKIHVVDYEAGGTSILYSTGEIATWATIDGRDVIVLYGNKGELHETAIKFTGTTPKVQTVSGSGQIKQGVVSQTNLALQYTTTGQTVVSVGAKTLLYIVDRANAYEFWSLSPPGQGALAAYNTKNPILVKGGYLIRSLSTSSGTLSLVGDLNSTASFEIIAPAADSKKVTFNGQSLSLKKTSYGTLLATKSAQLPSVSVPDLKSLTWKTSNSLPEVSSSYSDASWKTANKTSTYNPTKPRTPGGVVLYAGEYGYHTGNILWRAHFTASGGETAFSAHIQGGFAFGHSAWLGDAFIGSWEGDVTHESYNSTFNFPAALQKGKEYVITILQDHMGYEEDWIAASETFKGPRGILAYSFVGASTNVTTWKVTGNLGGEDYVDNSRGPLNEGGLYAERQGWHLPGFDDSKWKNGRPTDGISAPGVQFYRTAFDLNVPSGVDYPLALAVSNSTVNTHYRAQFYVNGWQFGKYVNSIGPQKSFPVPQGILNYQGKNTLAVSLWAQDKAGAKLNDLHLEVRAKIESSMAKVVNQQASSWTKRDGAY